ncbi:hypothetical protein LOAG_05598 [Loa loa]|uniref:Uncharacterized protein n=1 Tax=Loa loa TaxID=7209 RepID=A0A1S0TZQ3_LOALO|nr:hypothetical protein LOAG_05598 [Loa loa]EFO22886.1 hypothetical protein LOAG_05598 [Loa loa]
MANSFHTRFIVSKYAVLSNDMTSQYGMGIDYPIRQQETVGSMWMDESGDVVDYKNSCLTNQILFLNFFPVSLEDFSCSMNVPANGTSKIMLLFWYREIQVAAKLRTVLFAENHYFLRRPMLPIQSIRIISRLVSTVTSCFGLLKLLEKICVMQLFV